MNLSSVDHALDAIFRWTWQASLAAVVLIALVLVVSALFGRLLPARWRYALGLLILLRLALPVAPSSSLSIFNLTNRFNDPRESGVAPASRGLLPASSPEAPAGGSSPASELSVPAVVPSLPIADSGVAPASRGGARAEALPESSPEAPASPPKVTLGTPSIYSLSKYSWLLGSVTMLALVFRRHRHFSAQLRRWETVREPRVLELLDGCQAMLGVKRRVTVQAAHGLNTPALFGVFKPRLLVPAEMLRQLDDRELRHIFLHELVHLRRGDVLVNWAMIVLRALHWFNPAVWLAFRRLRADQELACDAAVLARLAADEQLRYGSTLVKLLTDFSATAICPGAVPFVTNKQTIKRRIKSIAAFRPAGRLAVAASCLLLAALVCGTFTRAAVTATGQSALPPAPLHIRIADDGTIRVGTNGVSLDVEQFRQALEGEVADHPHLRAQVLAGQAVPFQKIDEVMKLLQEKRIEAVQLRTSPVASASPSNLQQVFITPADITSITLSSNGVIHLEPENRVITRDGLEKLLLDASKHNPRATLQIQHADDDQSFLTPAWIYDIIRRAHVIRIEMVPMPTNGTSTRGADGSNDGKLPDTFLTLILQGDGTIRVGPGGKIISREELEPTLEAAVKENGAAYLRIQTAGTNYYGSLPEWLGTAIGKAKAKVIEMPAPSRPQTLDAVPDGIFQPGAAATPSTWTNAAPLSPIVGVTLNRDGTISYGPNAKTVSRDELKQILQAAVEKDPYTLLQVRPADATQSLVLPDWMFEVTRQANLRAVEIVRAPTDTSRDVAPPALGVTQQLRLRRELDSVDKQITTLKAQLQRSDNDTVQQYSLDARRINESIAEAGQRALQKRALLDQLNALSRADLRQVLPTTVPDAVLTQSLQDLNAADAKLATLSSTYGQNNPEVVAAKELSKKLNSQIDERAKGILKGLQTQIDTDVALIEHLRQQLANDAEKSKYNDFIQLKAELDKLEQSRDKILKQLQPLSDAGQIQLREAADKLARANQQFAPDSPMLDVARKQYEAAQKDFAAAAAGFDSQLQTVPATSSANVDALKQQIATLDEQRVKEMAELQKKLQELSAVVPTNATFFISGEVRHPGAYPCSGRTTAVQAVSVANGFTDFAAKKLQVTRAAGGKPIAVDYDKALKDPTSDVEIFPGDTVYVPKRVF